MRWSSIAAVVVAAALSGAGSASAQEAIEWRLKDRFRLFDKADAPARDRVERLLDQMGQRSRGSAEGVIEEHYAQFLSTLSGKDAAGLRTSNWSQAERRYADTYLYPRSYLIEARVTGGDAGRTCRWTVDGRPASAVEARCDRPVTLPIKGGFRDGDWGGSGLIAVASRAGGPLTSRMVTIRDRLVVAVGDSFVSGEGNPDVPADFSRLRPERGFGLIRWPAALRPGRHDVKVADWWDEPCHRTLLSWPVLTTLYEASRDPQGAITLVHLGCSGATTPEVTSQAETDLPGCPKGPPLRYCARNRSDHEGGQLQQLRTLRDKVPNGGPERRRIDRLFLSAGGNDIGFVGVIKYVALPPNDYALGPAAPWAMARVDKITCPLDEETDANLARFCVGRSAMARMADLPGRYAAAAAAFEQLGLTKDRVFQVQYPDILHSDGLLANGERSLCRHWLRAKEDVSQNPEAEQADREANPYRMRPSGFEAMQSVIPAFLPTFKRWNFEMNHPAGAGCPEPVEDASEVCKAEHVRKRLNEAVEANNGKHWRVVKSHVAKTSGHGWCVSDERHPLALPIVVDEGGTLVWRRNNFEVEGAPPGDGRGPAQWDPYDPTLGRWFRTPNDSFLTQYGGPGRIHHGTVHPTFRAHVAYAEAVADEAFPPR